MYNYKNIDYINLIDFCNFNYLKGFNLIINYLENNDIDKIVYYFSMWLLCLKKRKYKVCLKCINCNLLKKKNHPNFYYINNDVDINFIKKVYFYWFNNINYLGIKIVYLSKFTFWNFSVNTFLLKWIESSYHNSIFIFSCLNNIYIPFTILSRCYKIKLNFIKENKIYFYLNKKYDLNKFSKENILSIIRLSNNSIYNSIKILKKIWNIRLKLINFLFNIKKYNIKLFIKKINNIFLYYNLYFLSTIFLDFIKFKLNNIKYLYNLDIFFLFKKIYHYFSIKNSFLIFNKIIICINKIKNIKNINKNILLYELINYLFLKIE